DFDSVATLNPFSHDRRKTFQPHDLWEWLLRCAILLFVVDVGIRRIQIDHDEWQRALVKVKAWLLFWRGVPRPVQADESLAALLARRDQVRSRQATPVVDVDPALFQPERPAEFPVFARGDKVEAAPDPRQGGRAAVTPKEQQEEEQSSVTTTSRLLEAKRRAGKRK
ncbi:MAG TPA: hypothetical protein VMS21_00410, partial [Methylomirabilota bacterium]|nr:hypothetical protein [Methylomirabilota bacterium]